MMEKETNRILIRAEEVVLAALQGEPVTYTTVKQDGDSLKKEETVVQFDESPDEILEALRENNQIRNRVYNECPI
jgi:hypothetical protein